MAPRRCVRKKRYMLENRRRAPLVRPMERLGNRLLPGSGLMRLFGKNCRGACRANATAIGGTRPKMERIALGQ